MAIKTNISVKRLMELNPSIKTIEQAKKILHDVKTKPSISLDKIISDRESNINKGDENE